MIENLSDKELGKIMRWGMKNKVKFLQIEFDKYNIDKYDFKTLANMYYENKCNTNLKID